MNNRLPEHDAELTLDRPGISMALSFDYESRAELQRRDERAEAYLRRVVALTGAKHKRDYCVLEVGKTRFIVLGSHITRVRDVTDSMCQCEHTCFYLPSQYMPVSEKIATALLQLKNNPALFDGWFARKAILKPDGQIFAHQPFFY